jgi:hypothetical protein
MNEPPKKRFSFEISSDVERMLNDVRGTTGQSNSDILRHAINMIRHFDANPRFTPNEAVNNGVEVEIFREERSNLGKRLFSIEKSLPLKPRKAPKIATPRKVFISYAREDISMAKKIYRKLKGRGHVPWLDEYSLLKGADWKTEIENAIYDCEFFLSIISKSSLSKTGFVQVEVHAASQEQLKRPEGAIYFIPFKIDDADLPPKLSRFNYIDAVSSRRPYAEILDTIEASKIESRS